MANWAYVEDGTVKELRDILPKSWKNVSGLNKSENDIDFLKGLGWYKVVKQHQEYDVSLFDVASYTHVYDGVSVIETVNLVEKPPVIPETPEQLKENFLTALRAERNKRLFETDWTQILDSPITNREAWAVYRQELRDLPQLYADNNTMTIESVVWPKVVDNGV